MTEFKVLKYNEIFIIRLGLCSHDFLNRFIKSPMAYFIAIVFVVFIISSSTFVYQNISHIDVALRTSLVTIGVSQTLGMFLTFGFKIDKIRAVHGKLQAFVNASKKENEFDVIDLYWTNERNCQRFTRKLVLYTSPLLGSFVTALAKAIYDICYGKFDPSVWDLPFGLVFPFDTRTIFGWFIEWTYQISSGICYFTCNLMPTIYFATFCYYIVAICDHFKIILDTIRLDVEQVHDEKISQKQEQSWRNIKQKLNQAVEVHVKIYEIYKLAADINSGVIFFLLPANALVLGLSLFTMDRSEFDFVVFAMDVICLICTLIWPSIFCYFANSTADCVIAIGNIAYDLNWFDHPVEMQKYMVLMIERSQEPVYFSGFGLTRCTWEVLGKLVKTASSFYIIFRSLSQH